MKFLALFFVICSIVSCISAFPYPIGYPYSGLPVSSGFSGVGGASGYSGVGGASGYSGVGGASGYSGVGGASGYSGVGGASGYSGISGVSGFSGVGGVPAFGGYGLHGLQQSFIPPQPASLSPLGATGGFLPPSTLPSPSPVPGTIF